MKEGGSKKKKGHQPPGFYSWLRPCISQRQMLEVYFVLQRHRVQYFFPNNVRVQYRIHFKLHGHDLSLTLFSTLLHLLKPGATNGIGKETARVLALRGAKVIIPARTLESGQKMKDCRPGPGLQPPCHGDGPELPQLRPQFRAVLQHVA